jgi:hypothetical protein
MKKSSAPLRFLFAAFVVLASHQSAQANPKFLDTQFANDICQGWNKISLPQAVGRSRSGWIDSAGSTGKQVLVVNRRDCTNWIPLQLVIEADASGNAFCTSSEKYTQGKFR